MESERLDKLCLPPPPPGGAPWIVYLPKDGEKKMQTFSTLWPENKSYLKAIPELQGKLVRASSYGWLLLQDYFDESSFSLWNPMTLETISLPPLDNLFELDDDVWIDACVLTSSPDVDDDFVVFVFCDHLSFSCHPRSDADQEPRWQVDELEIEGRRASIRQAISCNGVIYAWATAPDDNGGLEESLITVISNISSSSISLTWLQLEKPDFIDSNCDGYADYLLESCGQAYHVRLKVSRRRINAVEIWELDLEEKEWVEVNSLNNRAFFLHGNCCTWCWGSAQVEGNSVFLPPNMDDGVNNTLCQYTLRDRSFTVYLLGPKLRSPWRQPFWFIPQGSHPRSLARPLQKPSIDELVDMLNQNADIVEDPEELLPKHDETTGNVLLNRLSSDIIAFISEYMHWFDYLNFRTTCKTFRSLIPPGRCQLRRNYDSSLRLFVSVKDNDGSFQVMDPIRNEARSITIPISPKVGAYSIEYGKAGWLILYSGDDSFHFLNLFTRVRWDFPPNNEVQKKRIMSIGFSTNPGSSDCVTVAMLQLELLNIGYFHSKYRTWELAEFEYGEFSPSYCSPLYHNGRFYFLDRTGCVGVFELVREKATWQVYGRPKTRDTQFHSSHLVECDRQVFAVFIGRLGKWVQVFRFDDLKKSWVKVNSLGGHIFFISPLTSVSTVATEVGMGNRIYLPNLHDNRFIFYSLETRKYHVAGTHVSMDSFYPSREPFECCWV